MFERPKQGPSTRRRRGMRKLLSDLVLFFAAVSILTSLVPLGRVIPRVQREIARQLLDLNKQLDIIERQSKFQVIPNNDVPIRIITLSRTEDRAFRTVRSIERQNITYELFFAIDGLQYLNETLVRTFAGRKKRRRLGITASWTPTELQQLHMRYLSSNLKARRLRQSLHERLRFGCFISHVAVWYNSLNNNFPFVVVLEDDVVISNDFLASLFEILEDLPKDWGLLYLNGCYRKLGPYLRKGLRLSRGGLCTYGYAISQNAIYSFLTRAALNSEKPVDHMMDQEVLSGRVLAFHADPPLVYPLHDTKSTLAY